MTIILRPMTDDDIPGIVDWMLKVPLWQRYGLQSEQIVADFQKGIARGDILYVADDNDAAGGFTWCLLDGMFGFCPYLKLLGVHPKKQGQNIGGLLLQKIESIAIQQRHQDMFLLVSDFNTGAQRFYQKHGYQQIGAVPHLVISDVSELIYWRSL